MKYVFCSCFKPHSTLSPLSLIPPTLPLLGHLHRLSSFSRTISLKSTQNNFSPQNSFQRHPLPLGALHREKPFIFDSRLSRNGSNVSCNRDECNQAGFWWANGWTRTSRVLLYLAAVSHFSKKLFFDFQTKSSQDRLIFRSIFLCSPLF